MFKKNSVVCVFFSIGGSAISALIAVFLFLPQKQIEREVVFIQKYTIMQSDRLTSKVAEDILRARGPDSGALSAVIDELNGDVRVTLSYRGQRGNERMSVEFWYYEAGSKLWKSRITL